MMAVLLSLAVVFLIGGLDALEMVQHSVSQTIFLSRKASSTGPFVQKAALQEGSGSETGYTMDSLDATVPRPFVFESGRTWSDVRTRMHSLDATVVPSFSFESEAKQCGDIFGRGNTTGRGELFSTNNSDLDLDRTHGGNLGEVVGVGVDMPDIVNQSSNAGYAGRRGARLSVVAANSVGRPEVTNGESGEAVNGGTSRCCGGLGKKVKRWMSRLPLNKLKILVVVWQILAVCSSITGIEFPVSYARFLAWINIANFDIGDLFSASCILPSMNFYRKLLVTTLAPLALTCVLALTYRMAKRRAGLGSAGVIARRAAWSRHVAAGLLLTFLVRFECLSSESLFRFV